MIIDSKPPVSVIIPVYNAVRYLDEAIGSVLAQTYRPTELIVVDDGSTDGSSEIGKKFQSTVRFVQQANLGAAAARNRGVEMAEGEFIAFLDADDRWARDKLTRQVSAFSADPELDIVFGQARQLRDGDDWRRGVEEETCPASELMAGIVPGTLLAKRDSFFRVGPLKTDYRVGEFIEWYMRAKDLGCKIAILPDLFLWRRIHDSNLGVRERKSTADYARVLKAGLDRRRAAQAK